MRVFPRLAIVLTDLAPWATTARSHTWRQAARLVAALAQKRQDLVDSVFDDDRGGRSKIDISGCIDNGPLIEPEPPSRFLGVGYDQVECLDIQELISGHCILLDGRNLHGEVGALVVVADLQYMLRETRSAILPRLV